MYAQIEKPKENKSRVVANSVAQKKSSMTQNFGFVDARSEVVAQKKLQKMADNNAQVKQLMSFKAMNSKSQAQIIQFGKRSRPSFSGPAKKLRQATNSNDDLAHRISYHDIEQIVNGGSSTQRQELIEKVTIPQRDFPQHPCGYDGYYKKVLLINDNAQLIRALNNCPFNLRPGIASVNRSIGAGFDPNVDDSGYETDQSKALRPHALTHDAQNRSSSYLSDKKLKKWEKKAFVSLPAMS